MTHRVLNFSAGPATLPAEVLERARRELLDYRGTGMSVMEMSHRSAVYDEIHRTALEGFRRILETPEDRAVLLLQGGASLQFSMVPMCLLPGDGSADYVLTGSWSKKALAQAERLGTARIAASTQEEGFRRIPRQDELDLDPKAAYVHLTTNNTIVGTQWSVPPETGDVPIVADMSSDIMARRVDMERFGLVYAGAQKNLGPAGVTVVVVRRDLLDRIPEGLPSMLDYRTHVEKDSLYNTPPTWAIYVVGLVCEWVEERGGLDAVARDNRAKAAAIYRVLDDGDFYRGTVESSSRSLVNIPFRLPSEELEGRFLSEAAEAGLVNLKGHRSVGGIRASLYNAMPFEGVETLVDFMDDFERRNG